MAICTCSTDFNNQKIIQRMLKCKKYYILFILCLIGYPLFTYQAAFAQDTDGDTVLNVNDNRR